MNTSNETSSLDRSIRQSNYRLFLATATCGSTALLTFGPAMWQYHVPTTLLAIAINLLAGAMMLLAFFRLLKNMDELQRQTHLEAMALAFGVTLIFTVIYGSLPTVQLLADTQPTNILFVMGISYILSVIGLWLGRTSE